MKRIIRHLDLILESNNKGAFFFIVPTKESVSHSLSGSGTWSMLTECGVVWLELHFISQQDTSGTRAGLIKD